MTREHTIERKAELGTLPRGRARTDAWEDVKRWDWTRQLVLVGASVLVFKDFRIYVWKMGEVAREPMAWP